MNTLLNQFNFDPHLNAALEKQQLGEATAVQAAAIPAILQGGDWQITAHTGSGKTLAYLLPALQHILTRAAAENPYRVSRPRLLVLVPTRELARQINAECLKLVAETEVGVCLLTGGEDFGRQAKALKKNPSVLIATPGRLLEHIEATSTDLSWLEILVLDEADRILDMGFSDDVLKIGEACNTERQTLLFSATLYHKGLGGVKKGLLKDPKNIVVDTVRTRHEGIEHRIILADNPTHKVQLLNWLLQHRKFGKALIFTNTREHAGSLHGALQSAGIRSALLHGEIPHETRKRVLELFSDGTVAVLIATDVASRGLDIKGIDLVINHELPRTGDDYAHRAGRTGRAGESGEVISLIGPREWNLMSSIKRYLGLEIEREEVPGLPAKFSGPRKQKKSGKAAGSKKKKRKTRKAEPAVKTKKRLRDRKNIGKRRKPTSREDSSEETSVKGSD